jgi:hypothetical protein
VKGRLHLRLNQVFIGGDAGQGVMANVYAAAGGRRREAGRDLRGIAIPAGFGEHRTVTVEPGRYLVEAVLPSGEILSEETEVPDGGDATVDLGGTESPHEWLGWQVLMGNVDLAAEPRARPDEADEADQAEGLEGEWAQPPGVAGSPPPAVHWIGDPARPLAGTEPANGEAWSLIARLLDAEEALGDISSSGPRPLEPTVWDEDRRLYRLAADGPASWDEDAGPDGSPVPRRYVLVDVGARRELVSVPVPWTNVQTHGQAAAELLVQAEAVGGSPVALSVRDPVVGSALAYMTAGALPAARHLFGQARDMLFGKMMNPLGAAGGGYVLLAVEADEPGAYWHEWIGNLRSWFPWLPDGAIQDGWLRLRHRRTDADVEAARAALFEGYDRGLPFYSAGIQWLVEGLTLLAHDDVEARRRLEQVQPIAWRVNVQQPFTTVLLRR